MIVSFRVALADRPGMIFWLVTLGGSSVGSAPSSYQGHRYPMKIISHYVWRCFRFPLSFLEVEELMPERGVVVSWTSLSERVQGS
ncbi:hypothetical protein ACVW19_000492 [Streptomyces sp. TE5632]